MRRKRNNASGSINPDAYVHGLDEGKFEQRTGEGRFEHKPRKEGRPKKKSPEDEAPGC